MLQIYHSAKEKIDFPQVSTSQPLRNVTVLGFTDKAFKLYRFQAGHHFQIKLYKKVKTEVTKRAGYSKDIFCSSENIASGRLMCYIHTAKLRIWYIINMCKY